MSVLEIPRLDKRRDNHSMNGPTRHNRIKEWRAKRGLSMQALAELVDATASTINKLEKRDMRLTDDWIYKLANALGVEPRQLLEDSDAVGNQPGGFHENGEPFEPPLGHMIRPMEHVAYIRIKTDDLSEHPDRITRGSLLAFDLNQVERGKVAPGKVCYFSLMRKDDDSYGGALIGQFLPPNKVMSNADSANWIVNLDDPNYPYEATLRGVLSYVMREVPN